jgi:hypothetical protein
MIEEKPKRNSSRSGLMRLLIIIGGGLIACIVFVVVLVSFVFAVTQPVVDASNAYLQAIQDGQLEDAYAMFAPSLQDELAYDDFVAIFGDSALDSWTVNQRSIENGIGKMSGSLTVDDESLSYELYSREIDGEWRITGYRFE